MATYRLRPAARDDLEEIWDYTLREWRVEQALTYIKEMNKFLRGWVDYFRLSTVKQTSVALDQWIRRRLRKILWEQWKKPKTQCRKLVVLGLNAERARRATATGRKAWWNAGASHMHGAVTNRKLSEWGLLSLLDQLQYWQRCT